MSVNSSNPFSLFTNCPQPVLVYSTDYLILDANEAAIHFFERPKSELLKLTALDLHAYVHNSELIAEVTEKRTVACRPCQFNTLAGIKEAQTCSYPIIVERLEVRVEIIMVVNAEAVPVQRNCLYSRLIKTLETMPVGFYLLDRNWTIMYWNAQAENIFDLNRERALGKNLWKLFPEAVHSKYFDEYTRAMESSESTNFEEYYWPLQKWGKISVQPIDDGLALFFSDITAYRAAEDSLKDNLEQLRELSFMHSHQMRRPVANILGLSQLLDEQNLSGMIQELNALIKQSTRELDDIITSSNARINSQQDSTSIRASLDVEAFNFDKLVLEVIDKFAIEFPQHSILAKCEAPIQFSGNRQAVSILLKILLESSIKFSQNVCQVLVHTNINHNNLILSVSNFGVVLPEGRLREIFLAVQNLHMTKNIGDGLQHALQIVNQHKGSMWVESSEADGTAFYFRFPLPVFRNLNQGREIFYEADLTKVQFSMVDDRFLYVCWRGIHDQYTIRKGCSEILSAIKKESFEGVIMDTRQVIGHWADACLLFATYFLPKIDQASVHKCSWIEPASSFGKFCIEQVVSLNRTSISVAVFTCKGQAVEWHSRREQI